MASFAEGFRAGFTGESIADQQEKKASKKLKADESALRQQQMKMQVIGLSDARDEKDLLDRANFIRAANIMYERTGDEQSTRNMIQGQIAKLQERGVKPKGLQLLLDTEPGQGFAERIGSAENAYVYSAVVDPRTQAHKEAMGEIEPMSEMDKTNLAIKQKELELMNKGKTKKYSQATGMPGYIFDETTGKFTADPEIAEALRIDAENLSNTESLLKGKDLAGVNDKVTALTKEVNGIYDSAVSLEGLMDRGSPAAKLSAIFKFMKANDPTSTVREGELGMVYAAEGAMKGFANKINSLMGEGGLSESGFLDLVNTAKTLANSAIDSSNGMVGSYLDVIRPNLDKRAFKKLTNRVPARFEIIDTEQPTNTPAVNTPAQKTVTVEY
jgi:hypothetical protein